MNIQFNGKTTTRVFLGFYFFFANIHAMEEILQDPQIKIISLPVDKEEVVKELKSYIDFEIDKFSKSKKGSWKIIEIYKNFLENDYSKTMSNASSIPAESLKVMKEYNQQWKNVLSASNITLKLLESMIQHMQKYLPEFMKKLKDEKQFMNDENMHESLVDFFREGFYCWTLKEHIEKLINENNDQLIDNPKQVYQKLSAKCKIQIFENTYLRGFLQLISITYGKLKASTLNMYEEDLKNNAQFKEAMKKCQEEFKKQEKTYKEALKVCKADLISAETTIKELKENVRKADKKMLYLYGISGISIVGFLITLALYLRK